MSEMKYDHDIMEEIMKRVSKEHYIRQLFYKDINNITHERFVEHRFDHHLLVPHEEYGVYDWFINAINSAGELISKAKDVKDDIFETIYKSSDDYPLNNDTIINCLDRLFTCYIGMRTQTITEGLIKPKNELLGDYNYSFYRLLGGPIIHINPDNIKNYLMIWVDLAKDLGVEDLGDGYVKKSLIRLNKAFKLCDTLTDIYLMEWSKETNQWTKNDEFEIKMKGNDYYRVRKSNKAKVLNEPKLEKITTKPKVEKIKPEPIKEKNEVLNKVKSQPTKTKFKSNEMSESNEQSKPKLSLLFNEAVKALNKDFSNFDAWFNELNSHLEDYEIYLYGDEIATNEFLTVLLAYMTRMLMQGKVSLEKIDEINNYLYEYFGDEVLNHPYYKRLGDEIKEINDGGIVITGKRKRRVEPKPINAMPEVDKAKTGESVNEAQKPTKEKVIRVARTPKPKLDFAEVLKKQLKSTIKEHPFNFEVYQNPTKSTITFNKKGDIATIRPTFKAKITFP